MYMKPGEFLNENNKMKILALDSSTEACSVALLSGQNVIEKFEVIGRGHAEHLLPMIDSILNENSVTLDEIDLFAYGAGPGSFTGLRIGAAMMQGLFQQALEMSGEFSAVLPPASRARPDLVLEGALFDFSHHIESNGTSSGVIRLSVNLVDNRTKQVVASKALLASVPSREQNAVSAVAALNDAAASIVRELLEWLKTELANTSA